MSELFGEMFREPIAMWIYIGLFLIIGIYSGIFFLNQIGFFQKIQLGWTKFKEKFIDKKKQRTDDIWNFNPFVMMFGGIAIVFIIITELITERIKKWWLRHRWNVVLLLINGIVLTPLFLLLAGVVERLPEFYFPLFLFYGMIMLVIIASRSDNKRSGHQHNYNHNRYDNYNNSYGYYNPQNNAYVKPKPKPKGLSEEQVTKKKQKIREKLIQDKILQE